MRSENEISKVSELYSDMIRRICFYRLKNRADTDSVVNKVLLKYMRYEGSFLTPEHEKAWFVRATLNICKDYSKSLLKRRTVSYKAAADDEEQFKQQEEEVLQAVVSLPQKYRDAVYLYYFEGYSASEIAAIIDSRENTVYSLLSRGRTLLKKRLGDNLTDE